MALCIGYEPPPLSKGENIVSAVDNIIWELSNWPRIAINSEKCCHEDE